jgi:hypothetical protein
MTNFIHFMKDILTSPSSLAVLGYLIAFILYIFMAQIDNPLANHKYLPYLPWHPYRVFKLNVAFGAFVWDQIFGPGLPIAIRWLGRKLIAKRADVPVIW